MTMPPTNNPPPAKEEPCSAPTAIETPRSALSPGDKGAVLLALASETLSEGQAAKLLGQDRVMLRRAVELMRQRANELWKLHHSGAAGANTADPSKSSNSSPKSEVAAQSSASSTTGSDTALGAAGKKSVCDADAKGEDVVAALTQALAKQNQKVAILTAERDFLLDAVQKKQHGESGACCSLREKAVARVKELEAARDAAILRAEEAEKEIERLRAVVDRLPVTGDGKQLLTCEENSSVYVVMFGGEIKKIPAGDWALFPPTSKADPKWWCLVEVSDDPDKVLSSIRAVFTTRSAARKYALASSPRSADATAEGVSNG